MRQLILMGIKRKKSNDAIQTFFNAPIQKGGLERVGYKRKIIYLVPYFYGKYFVLWIFHN